MPNPFCQLFWIYKNEIFVVQVVQNFQNLIQGHHFTNLRILSEKISKGL